MNKKIDGLKQAIEMLQGLDLAAQQSLIAEIARKDPEMAIKLKQNLVTFDDLKYLTVAMMKRLLQDIDLDVLGLALRGASKEVTDHLLNMFSTNMKRDVEDYLKGKPRPLSEVLEAQKKIMDVVIRLRDKGEIVLSKDKSERYV
ncbi:FliG C-terminal domain-containing protein [Peredibacter starrii]|uniref:FliG C-terminal domain-containing protein n=1 Tax=Peredibacter starrii TaxID=28202 RepID=A0AAX4HS69_9BACT|nr:FliG C-terminal domain-containing protein [Peredibacter starrii]WPU66205.1 FliG C-terminal domain-containing protein [Peredibacter starrii]